MPRLLRRAAASASGLRLFLTTTFGAAGRGGEASDARDNAGARRVRSSRTDDRLERLEL